MTSSRERLLEKLLIDFQARVNKRFYGLTRGMSSIQMLNLMNLVVETLYVHSLEVHDEANDMAVKNGDLSEALYQINCLLDFEEKTQNSTPFKTPKDGDLTAALVSMMEDGDE